MCRTITLLLIIFLMIWPMSTYSKERDRLREPIPEEEIQAYDHIKFTMKNFAKVEKGMTEEQVLELLGKPLKVAKEHRRHNRWTVHFYYPDNHVVNFKNGLVVGKE